MTLLPAVSWAATVSKVTRLNPTTAEVWLDNGQQLTIDFYGPSIFRLFQDNSGGILRSPESNPPAEILVAGPRRDAGAVTIDDGEGTAAVSTAAVRIDIDKATARLTVTDLRTGKAVVRQVADTEFKSSSTTVTLEAGGDEYFYGGGVQNGRFSHKGHSIQIVNTNSWTDGGVASPAPFYWSTGGYGVLAYTFAPGVYDFDSGGKGTVTLKHDTSYLDLFVMVDATPTALLSDYYQLTGNPVLLPKFAFYEGHLNAYNRDYWKETDDPKRGVLFEDGKRYVESQKDNGGIRESLNGEQGNYQFSARAVVDRYHNADMPLGWVLPNDGYGAGYGQTETLDGNIQNLKSFGDYARSKGVEVGLWTQSNLHPKDSIPALLQRDIVKEVRDAGVRVLKTDVAWVGYGYSFGLNGIADVAQVMPYYGNDARPFIITLDGWAGTQRYGGVWTGDQTGGEWEYIRFHIPTYIGSGLSGMGNITSDMDGIFGGRNMKVNIRDFQWKTFTPMQLNMDGWGANEKYPQALGEPATSINRSYLKLKSALLPYTYSAAHEAVTGKPLIRAMFLDDPSPYTYGAQTRYQYMYGPSFLVAPVYQETACDTLGNDIRNGIYLPQGTWYDYFTGEQYQGGRILNDFPAPLWKIPVFVKGGAIIPMTKANNNIHEVEKDVRHYEFYPEGHSEFTEYDDDGVTEAYLRGQSATTKLQSELDQKGNLRLTVCPTEGSFDGMVKEKATTLYINATQRPRKVEVKVNGRKLPVVAPSVGGQREEAAATVSFDEGRELNTFSTKGSAMEGLSVRKNPQIVVAVPRLDVTASTIEVDVKGYAYSRPATAALTHGGTLRAPGAPKVEATPYALTPSWNADPDADYYEIAFGGETYSTITGGSLKFDDLQPATAYDFQLRAVNKDGASPWTAFTAKTGEDPLRYALTGLTGQLVGARDMDGFGVQHLFDGATSGDIWHTHYQEKAVPFDLIIDLHQTATLDKMQYLPRPVGTNGMIQTCEVSWSKDKKTWTSVGAQQWKADATTKEVAFSGHPEARYVKLSVTKAVGDFGSGNEIRVFRVPGTKTLIPGDINQDGKINDNDLTSYMNYTGLKKGDSDFDGYISNGDINLNGIIDAADISNVAVLLDGGLRQPETDTLAGTVTVGYDKAAYKAGDEVVVTVSGNGMKAVNAIGLVVPYSPQQLRYEKVEPVAVAQMRNMTYDRHHTDGSQVLYPTFVNLGEKPVVEGAPTLFTIHFKALRAFRPSKQPVSGMLVDKNLNELDF